MVKVTLEFPSIDVAIIELGKLALAAKPVAKEKKGAKATPEQVKQIEQEAIAARDAPLPPVVEEPVAKVYTLADAQAAMKAYYDKTKTIEPTAELLGRYGVRRTSELKPDQYSSFVIEAGQLVSAK